MEHSDRIRICDLCKNHTFDLTRGIECGLTGARPAFEGECTEYVEDPVRRAQREQREALPVPRYSAQQKRRLAMVALPIFLALLAAVAYLLSLRADKLRQVRTRDLLTFAHSLAQELENGNADALDDAIDFGSLVARSTREVRAWDRRMVQQLSLGWNMVLLLRDGNRMELVDLQEYDDRAFALYRVLGNSLDHFELELVHHNDRVRVVDLFRFSTGSQLSEAMAEQENLSEHAGLRLIPQLYKAREFHDRIILGQIDEVWEDLMQFDPMVRTSVLLRSAYLPLAADRGAAELRMAMDEITSLRNCDPRFLNYQAYFIALLENDGHAALDALNALQRHLRKDPWMGALIARAQLLKGDTALSEEALDQALMNAPFDEELHFERLLQLASWGRYTDALQQADNIIMLLGYSRSEIAAVLDSIPGIDTTRALYDWR